MHEDSKVPTDGANVTAEGAALILLQLIAGAENKRFNGLDKDVDRKWILSTYAECLDTIRLHGIARA